MSLMRWYRRRPLPTVWDQMEHMAREMSRLAPWSSEDQEVALSVPLDIYETEKEVVVKAEVPGVKKEDLQVSIQDNNLTIRGESKHEEEVKEEGYYRKELRTGSFFRSVALPVQVKEEDLAAKYENGVLTVRAPKAVEEKVGRKVEVE